MGFADAIRSGFRKYGNFSGRASRSEYWWWVVFALLVAVVAAVLDGLLFPGSIRGPYSVGVITVITSIALLLPGLAVSVRRLHDTDRSGWWLLLEVIPFIGWIVLLFFLASPGTLGVNRFGPPPTSVGSLPGYDSRPATPGSL
jgi:uncharacterized membrane protein YhaH (DUF805 family)